ncbi:probable F-box protein At4g22060 [Musa acuminata AAA Group]|uniref:probable F-box protein At4g22060 n=1 Tax=Musa acuminata AAA Group TaxID=214697 RepID=UPI0031D00356
MDFVKRRRIASYTCKEEDHQEEEEEEEEEGLDAKRRDWSSLTEPLLRSVLRRLDSLEDFFAFRGVCRSWRELAAPTPDALSAQLPLILLTRFPAYTEAFYDLDRRRLYRAQLPWRVHSRRSVAYAHGHLITATDPPNSKLLLWNIFSESRIRLPKVPEPFRRVRLSSHPSDPALDCIVVLFAKRSTVLQYCRVGDSLWTIRDWSMLRMVDDMIFFRDNRLYALTATMQLVVVDLAADPKLWLLGDGGRRAAEGHRERWLAESGGELMVLCHRFRGGFDVCRWDSGSCSWVEVLDLGGRTVFLGSMGFAGSIAAAGSGIRGNCIYYVSYRKDAWYVFSLEEQSVEVVYPDSPGLLRGQSPLDPVWPSKNLGPTSQVYGQ